MEFDCEFEKLFHRIFPMSRIKHARTCHHVDTKVHDACACRFLVCFERIFRAHAELASFPCCLDLVELPCCDAWVHAKRESMRDAEFEHTIQMRDMVKIEDELVLHRHLEIFISGIDRCHHTALEIEARFLCELDLDRARAVSVCAFLLEDLEDLEIVVRLERVADAHIMELGGKRLSEVLKVLFDAVAIIDIGRGAVGTYQHTEIMLSHIEACLLVFEALFCCHRYRGLYRIIRALRI